MTASVKARRRGSGLLGKGASKVRADSNDDRDLVPPNAATLAESIRAFPYDLATALADLADNSLFHRSCHLRIQFHWAGEGSAIATADDGDGMDEPTLIEAMRLGSQSPKDRRDPLDLGRFGFGLKTASFSQARRVTVATRRQGDKQVLRCWDLDHIAEKNEWRLLREATPLAAKLTHQLASSAHGTVVIWEKLDRITAGTATENDADEDAFLRKAEHVGAHFSSVFHRYMTGKHAVKISVNGKPIDPWDPFLSDEEATQRLAVEQLRFQGNIIEVEPFILPHLSKISDETHRLAAGLRGWNAHQGFYVYRNSRLLVPGSWLGIKNWRQEEHYKLARIRVDLPNSLDQEFEIDVTKSRAHPPERLRREFARIGEVARSVAKRVYSYRGAKLAPISGSERVFLWEQTAKHNSVFYRLNREHPLVKHVRGTCAEASKFTALLRLIEETIPVPLIMITDREKPDRTSGQFEKAKEAEILDVMQQVFAALTASGLSRGEAVLRLAQIEPFDRFPQLLQVVKEQDR